MAAQHGHCFAVRRANKLMMRVLILDDDPIHGRGLADQLRWDTDGEIQAVVCRTLDEALRTADDPSADLEAFLIDELLGPGKDGIVAMQELQRVRPDVEAIIFTGAIDDAAVGLRAMQSGAWHYLAKRSGMVAELILRLRSLHGLRMVNRATTRAQSARSFKEIADVIVQASLQLGFERARFWKMDEARERLIGVSAAGEGLPGNFEVSIPLAEAQYARWAFEAPHGIALFHAQELGSSYLATCASPNGYLLPQGDWLAAALRSDAHRIGLLVLDNVAQPREITAGDLRLLRQFCSSASAALERAQLHEHIEQLKETGASIMSVAAHGNLEKLLKQVRGEIGGLTDAHNFIAALIEEEGNRRYLHYCLRYEDGRLQPPSWRLLSGQGLLDHMIARGEPLFLPDQVDDYRRKHGLQAFGKPAKSWMGVPLRAKGRIVGAIAVEKNRGSNPFTRDEFEKFKSTVEHIQGAIHLARLEAQQERHKDCLRLLQRASAVMMQLADEKGEKALWLTALTAATADYGLRFNRAALFLAKDGGARLIGRAGVGHFDRETARSAWAADRRANMTFDRVVEDLRRSALRPTPVHCEVHGWEIDLSSEEGDIFRSVLHEGKLRRVPAAKAAQRLPKPFVERFGEHDCAVIPLRAGSRVIGLVVVDNAHDGKPISRVMLDYLESLLAQAALTYEDYRQRKAYERLNQLTCEVLSHAGRQSLKDTLNEICKVALQISDVDCAAIIPASEAGLRFTYELEHAVSASWKEAADPVRMPRPDDATEYALRTGMLVVEDVNKHDTYYAGKPITEHPTLREEGVRALMCTPIRAAETGETLGAFRLYWRSPQTFTKSDQTQAEMFARLAAVVIQHWRAARRVHAAAERERIIHQRVMREALEPDVTQERMVRALLDAAKEALDVPDAIVEVDLLVWEPPEREGDEPRQERHEFYLRDDGEMAREKEADLSRGVVGRACVTGETQLASDAAAGRGTRTELAVPILHRNDDGDNEVGVLVAEAPRAHAFNAEHARVLERLAEVAALALDNARRLEGRRRVLETSKSIAAPINLDETLKAIRRVMRDIAPDASAFTIWHTDLADKQMKLGAYSGVRDTDALHAESASDDGVIRRVLERKRPLFVSRAENHPFSSDFVAREAIRSYAALPLRAENQEVGVMFLDYRHPHRFTAEEKLLFEVLADLAAASIRDTALLEFAGRQRDQRDLAQRAAEDAATTSSKDEALRRIMTRLKEHYPHAGIAIYTYAGEEDQLEVYPASFDFYPFENASETGILKVDDSSIAGHVARLARERQDFELYNCPNASTDPYFLPGAEGMCSELCVSLMSVSRDLLGVLILESPKCDAFDEDDEEQILGIARQISLVMERAEMSDRLVLQTSLAEATGGFVEFAHVARSELMKIRRRAAWLSQKESKLSERGRCWLSEVEESAARLQQAFREAQSDDSDAALEPLPCDELIRALVEEACEQRPTMRLELVWDLQCGDACMKVKRKALRWVLGHLVRNAVEAMESDGRSDGRRRSDGRLSVHTRLRARQWVEVCIEDDGPGIDPAVRPYLFKQAIPGRPGRGMGLLRVRQRVESMGGTVRLVDPAPGRGTTFAITLQVAQT